MKQLLVLLLFSSMLFAKIVNFIGLGYDDLNINPKQVCPVKQVSLPKNRDFIGVVSYKDGTYDIMSSPKYTFKQSHNVKKEGKKEIDKIFVTDYKTKKLIDATKAYYVFGSILMSVGGDDIIPFALLKDAQDFMNKHKGKKIYKIDRMNENFINYLDIR